MTTSIIDIFKVIPSKRPPINLDVDIYVNLDENVKHFINEFRNPVKRTIIKTPKKLGIEIVLELKDEILKPTKGRKTVLGNITNKRVGVAEPAKKTLLTDIDFDDDLILKYSSYVEKAKLKIEPYYLNNRINFINQIRKQMVSIQFDDEEEENCFSKQKTSFKSMVHQLIVQRYLNSYTPYRGLLLYHGLGSGKTCSSISMIEGMYTSKQIFIVTPASLQANYRTQMKFCGDQIFRKNNHWVFESVDTIEKKKTVFSLLNIDPTISKSNKIVQFVEKNRGIWMVNTDKEPNFDSLSIQNREVIDKQIELMIMAKYRYINYNGITRKTWVQHYKTSPDMNPFDNSTIIVDEAHNFVSRIVNKLNSKGNSISTDLYEAILSAENCRVILLTGTPFINSPSELGVLFNLINGYTYSLDIKLAVKNTKVKLDYFEKLFKEQKMIDILEYNQNSSTLKIVKNPYGFMKLPDGRMIYNDDSTVYLKDFAEKIITLLKSNTEDFTVIKTSFSKYKKLPDTLKEFSTYFINPNNTIKNKEFFQSRIIGMVSYLGDKKELMPKIVKTDNNDDIFIDSIVMSPHQLKTYAKIREEERRMEREQKGKEESSSSYRVFSRLACNFAFPDELPRPLPKGGKLDETIIDATSEEEMLNDADGKYDEDDVIKRKKSRLDIEYEQNISMVLSELEKNPEKYFESGIQKYVNELSEGESILATYSPKYMNMLKNLMNPENIGCHLVYSNFRKLEGIGLLRLILLYHGYRELKVVRNERGTSLSLKLIGMYSDDQYTENKVFALYTGTESPEEKEIIRNIYNNNLKAIPNTIQEELKKMFPENIENGNLYGEIIQTIMITASGAEGIDLKNTRFVHIMEPYWHHVRVNQVIGRARRICSHSSLPENLQTVQVFMYITEFGTLLDSDDYVDLKNSDNSLTTDQSLYKLMERKQELSTLFLDTLKEASVDCLVNYDNKSKCISYPHSSHVNKLITQLDYKQDAITSYSKAEDKEKHKLIVRKIKVDDELIPFAVDESVEPNIAYDYFNYVSKNILLEVGKVTGTGTDRKIIMN
jgi:hypothetical protein